MQSRARLTLVSGEELLRPAEEVRLPSLESQPTRPGEVPRSVLVDLDPASRSLVSRTAAGAGVPVEVWIRIGVEARRALEEVAVSLGVAGVNVEWLLDRAVAESQARRAPVVLHPSPLALYADSLRAARASSRALGRGQIAVAVSERELAAWQRDAGDVGSTLGAFIAEKISHAPASASQWEAEAAASGRTITEWAYRVAAARPLRIAARPQRARRGCTHPQGGS